MQDIIRRALAADVSSLCNWNMWLELWKSIVVYYLVFTRAKVIGSSVDLPLKVCWLVCLENDIWIWKLPLSFFDMSMCVKETKEQLCCVGANILNYRWKLWDKRNFCQSSWMEVIGDWSGDSWTNQLRLSWSRSMSSLDYWVTVHSLNGEWIGLLTALYVSKIYNILGKNKRPLNKCIAASNLK